MAIGMRARAWLMDRRRATFVLWTSGWALSLCRARSVDRTCSHLRLRRHIVSPMYSDWELYTRGCEVSG